MTTAVLDTNVIVSALLKPQSKPELVLRLFFSGYARVLYSREILEEYRGVLERDKFRPHISGEAVMAFLDELKSVGNLVEPKQKVSLIKVDPADNIFLECALEAKATFLITGNTRHFPFKSFKKTKIITADRFLQLIAPNL